MLQQLEIFMFGSNGLKRKAEGMIQINQNDIFSPRTNESNQQTIGFYLKQKFDKLHHRQKERIIKNVFHNLYGRHEAIDYQEEYNFQQRWQEFTKPTYLDSKYSLSKTENLMPTFLQILLLLLYAGNTWFLTIYRLFEAENLIIIFAPLILATQIKDICLKMHFAKKAINQNHLLVSSTLSWKDYLRLHWMHLIYLPYFIFLLLEDQTSQGEKAIYFIFVDIFFIWRAYLRLSQIYSSIKIRIMGSKARNQLQVVQLLVQCIYIVHFFGIILYFVSRGNSQNNWTQSVNNFDQNWISRYIHSLYFASTTLTTVGYGDITPKNIQEIITTFFIQIFGIINFGYIVNQIGRILSKINEKQEILTKNISQAEKIAETYKIPQELALQMRDYIINNQIAHDQLNIQEEDNFMRKLNDQIREGFNSLNQIRVIKSSVFFLCHWSKKFQRKIASRLIRNIYAPQENIMQIQGKQKIYLLTKGKIEINACIFGQTLPIAVRPLKVIQINPNKEVHFNTYGYSSLISGHNINLKAVVKDYSICYTLTRQDFDYAIIQDRKDFEYFHEIKSKIQQSYFKQIWEAPSITNTRQHYLPNPFYILSKNRQRIKKQEKKRKSILRKFKKSKCYIQSDPPFSSQEIISEQSQRSSDRNDEKSIPEPSLTPQNDVLTAKQRKIKYENILNPNKPYLIKNRGYSQRRPKKSIQFQTQQDKKKYEQKLKKQAIINNLQQSCRFQAYFPKFNLKKVIEKYQKIYHKRIYFDTRSEVSQKLETVSQIPQQVLQKLLNIRVFGSQNLDSN